MSTAHIEGRDVSPLYLYAIVPSGPDGAASPEMDGMANRVSMIGAGRYAAVVGDGLAQGLKGRSREELGRLLVAHQQVVEQIMRTTPLLPVQFGTQVPDEMGVRKVLERGSSLFESAFAEFRGCTQLEILVTWDLDAVFAGLAAEAPIASLKAQLASGAASAASREAFGRRVKEALELRRTTLAARLSAALRTEATDVIIHPVSDDRVVLHVALLLKNDALAAVERQLEGLDTEYAGSLRFRCVGPMPPSSFATVQVDFLDADAVARACRVLDVDAQASLNDIRAVYHRRARMTHPDAADDRGQAQPMAELTDAYKVLSLYARAREAGAGGDELDELDPPSGARAVLVSLRRQDSAADAGAGNG